MRRLKHKHTRRAVQFFEINHGFRKPFKVILDGNFVHALRETSLGEPADVLSKLLGGPVKCYVPRCVLLELKGLGADFSDTLGAARKAGLHLACGHDDKALAPTDCILSNIGDANVQHYFVATQEKALRGALGRVPGSASVFLNANGVHLEPPSATQRKGIEQVDQQNMGVSEQERGAAVMKDLAQLQQRPRERSIFRRKGAKGPNPLAIRKKQKRKEAGEGGPVAAQEGTEGKAKRKRVRVRRKGDADGSGDAAVS